jgi:hypothetical protein
MRECVEDNREHEKGVEEQERPHLCSSSVDNNKSVVISLRLERDMLLDRETRGVRLQPREVRSEVE